MSCVRTACAVLLVCASSAPVSTAAPLSPSPSPGDTAGRQEDGRRILDVPYLPQSEDLCGGAALAMVMRYWGERQVFAEDFAPLVDRSRAGILTTTLVAAVGRRGWRSVPFAGDAAAGARLDRGADGAGPAGDRAHRRRRQSFPLCRGRGQHRHARGRARPGRGAVSRAGARRLRQRVVPRGSLGSRHPAAGRRRARGTVIVPSDVVDAGRCQSLRGAARCDGGPRAGRRFGRRRGRAHRGHVLVRRQRRGLARAGRPPLPAEALGRGERACRPRRRTRSGRRVGLGPARHQSVPGRPAGCGPGGVESISAGRCWTWCAWRARRAHASR